MPLNCPGLNSGVLPQVAIGAGIGTAATQADADAAAQKEAETNALASALALSSQFPCPGGCNASYVARLVDSGANAITVVQGGGLFNSFGWAKAQLDVTCSPVVVPLTGVQAVEFKLKAIAHFNELIAIPVPEPEHSVFLSMRNVLKAFLLQEITSLTATPAEASDFWEKVGHFVGVLVFTTAIEKVAERIGAGLLGRILGPIIHIMADPTPIGGVDTQTLDTLDVITPPNCFRITWFRTRFSDELIWGPVRIRIERIECPPIKPAPIPVPPKAPVPPKVPGKVPGKEGKE